jgi:hypothetical protein
MQTIRCRTPLNGNMTETIYFSEYRKCRDHAFSTPESYSWVRNRPRGPTILTAHFLHTNSGIALQVRPRPHPPIDIGKGKDMPVTGRGAPDGCETSRLPHFLDNRLTDGGESVRLTRSHPLPPRRFLILISIRSWVDPRAIVRLEELGKFEFPMTTGIEPATFRPVTHCLDYATACPASSYITSTSLFANYVTLRRYIVWDTDDK